MIRIDTNAKELKKQLDRIPAEQLPFARSLIANRMAELVVKNEVSVMRARLDRPTPFTVNSLRIKRGNKAKPFAEVRFKDFGRGPKDWHYLNPQVGGGDRLQKGAERMLVATGRMKQGQYLLPASGARKDAYGNMQQGQLKRVLSSLKSGDKGKFFFAEIDGTAGVWERVQSGFGEGVKPIMIVSNGSPKYRTRFPFFEVAESTVKANYERIAFESINEALATARK